MPSSPGTALPRAAAPGCRRRGSPTARADSRPWRTQRWSRSALVFSTWCSRCRHRKFPDRATRVAARAGCCHVNVRYFRRPSRPAFRGQDRPSRRSGTMRSLRMRRTEPLPQRWPLANTMAVSHHWNASLAEIESHDGDWVVDGPPVTYINLGATSNFQVERRPVVHDDCPLMHPQRESPPGIEQLERFLAGVFLRRYVTYCVRRRRYAQAQGAAGLWRELTQAS